MKKRSFWLFVLFASLLMPGMVMTQEQDVEGSKDHPLFKRKREWPRTGASIR
jgi:hypothetical protein